MTKYEILFEIKQARQTNAYERVFVESQDVKLDGDWVEFFSGGDGILRTTVAAFPREKIFGFVPVVE